MILGDYHTHTVYSHGKSTIEENCQAAVKAGLKEIAITDHGFAHLSYGVRQKKFLEMTNDIKMARLKFPELKIYLGMECNLLDSRGGVDLNQDEVAALDLIVLGYHRFVKASSVGGFFKFNLPVFMSAIFKTSSRRKTANTDAFIKAMDRYPVAIISHPSLGIDVDLQELAKAAKHFGTYLELNGKRVSLSRLDADTALTEGAEFIVNSDAHSADRVGEISKPLSFIKESGILTQNIANWDKLPNFR